MNKALFLDRDGVINYDNGYTHKKENFVFAKGIFELCRAFEEAGFMIFVITNQAGIAKGYYGERDFLVLTEWMSGQFKLNGVNITKTYYCPYHTEAKILKYKKDSFDRKPNPGMILKARDEFSVDLSQSVLIGDMEHDISAGKTAGIGCNIIIGKIYENADFCFNSIADVYMARVWERK